MSHNMSTKKCTNNVALDNFSILFIFHFTYTMFKNMSNKNIEIYFCLKNILVEQVDNLILTLDRCIQASVTRNTF